MLNDRERAVIDGLWATKRDQDGRGLPKSERHRNLHPDSAELVATLAAGLRAQRLVEIGGSSGISTVALACAARRTGGVLTSIEIEPARQAIARRNADALGLAESVRFVCADAASVLPGLAPSDFALLDCEKEDYVRFFDMLRLAPGAIVVADNILSHDLTDYVAHVRSRPGVESVTLAVGKGLEISRVP